MTRKLEQKANRIAREIFALVERANGPVTMRRVEREVTGFATQGEVSWDRHLEIDGDRRVLWDGMSKAGSEALHEVIFSHRVAVQCVSVLNYLSDGGALQNRDWSPIALLPVKGANLYTPKVLLRVPQELLLPAKMKPDWRILTPAPLNCSVDLTLLSKSFSEQAIRS